MTDYAMVLTRRYPNRQWKINGNDYSELEMMDNGKKPAQSDLDSLWPEVQNEIADQQAAQVAAKQSARAKLAALGLTDEEVAALIP